MKLISLLPLILCFAFVLSGCITSKNTDGGESKSIAIAPVKPRIQLMVDDAFAIVNAKGMVRLHFKLRAKVEDTVIRRISTDWFAYGLFINRKRADYMPSVSSTGPAESAIHWVDIGTEFIFVNLSIDPNEFGGFLSRISKKVNAIDGVIWYNFDGETSAKINFTAFVRSEPPEPTKAR